MGPAAHIFSNTSEYTTYKDDLDLYHRVDGPAFIRHSDGRASWFIHGDRHRVDGPAIIQPSSSGIDYSWFLDGKTYEFDIWLELTPLDDDQKLLLKLQYG